MYSAKQGKSSNNAFGINFETFDINEMLSKQKLSRAGETIINRNMNSANQRENNLGNSISNRFNNRYDGGNFEESRREPNNMKIQFLESKLYNMERQHNEDKQILLDIINKSLLNQNSFKDSPYQVEEKERLRNSAKFRSSKKKKRSMMREQEENEESEYEEESNRKSKKKSYQAEIPKTQNLPGFNLEETNKTISELRDLKENLNKLIENEERRNYIKRKEMEGALRNAQTELAAKFEQLENTRRLQVASLKYIMEQSGSSRVKNMSRRLFGDCKCYLT